MSVSLSYPLPNFRQNHRLPVKMPPVSPLALRSDTLTFGRQPESLEAFWKKFPDLCKAAAVGGGLVAAFLGPALIDKDKSLKTRLEDGLVVEGRYYLSPDQIQKSLKLGVQAQQSLKDMNLNPGQFTLKCRAKPLRETEVNCTVNETSTGAVVQDLHDENAAPGARTGKLALSLQGDLTVTQKEDSRHYRFVMEKALRENHLIPDVLVAQCGRHPDNNTDIDCHLLLKDSGRKLDPLLTRGETSRIEFSAAE